MKKVLLLLLAMVMVLGICACGETEAPATDAPAASEKPAEQVLSPDQVPMVGTWINEQGKNCFRFHEGGKTVMEAVAKKTNNSTGEKSFGIIKEQNYSWGISGDKITIGKGAFTPILDDGTYKLVGEKVTYVRVGELDYELDLRFVVE